MYEPHKAVKRVIKPANWWMILKTDEGIIDYYKYWLKTKYDIRFEKTIWGSHISVNRGFTPPKKELWGKYEGEEIEFSYSNRIYLVNQIFFCIDAYSARLEEIRLEMGLMKQPNHGFHITVGRINKQYSEERSTIEGWLKCSKKY